MNQAQDPSQGPGHPELVAAQAEKRAKPKSSWLNLLVDFGPLLVFFIAYKVYAPAGDDALGVVVAVTKSTLAFMAATVVSLVVSKWRLGHVSPMVWLSTVLIVGFGALTVLLNDPFWIQVKPTAVYLMFAAVLFAGLMRGKPMLRYLLQAAFEGLDEAGWLKLSRNWAIFFLFLAVLNEVLRHFYNARNGGFDVWLNAKVWGFTVLSFVFTFTQLPMVLRHGLGESEEKDVVSHPPHD
ncbi:MAG TPA: inner membrane-spanning protein YciB [Novosphingobium sp.]|nr:inner membrane-spanning protein YciB [Novosphingobium sp.]